MKVGEIREIIKKHKKEDLHYLIVELYKLVPKNKIVDYQVDSIICNPKPSKEKPKAKLKAPTIDEISAEIDTFLSNAKADYYLMPNNVVAKKDRSKWRFVVKKFYKDIEVVLEAGNNRIVCAMQLRNLYELLSKASAWKMFSTFDVFDSIGITQVDFFINVIRLYRDSADIKDFIRIASKLAHENYRDRNTVNSELAQVILYYCNTHDMKQMMIDELKLFYGAILAQPEGENARLAYGEKMSYEKKEKLNNISESLVLFYGALSEFENAVKYFNEMYIEKNKEIKLYVLLQELFSFKEPQVMLKVINDNIHVKPRESVLNIKKFIEQNNELPQYFR